jgi:hypothetical protein
VLVLDKAEHKGNIPVQLQMLRTEPDMQQLRVEMTAFWSIAPCGIVEAKHGDGGSTHL